MQDVSTASHKFFATCAKSLESLLEQELLSLQASDVRQTVAGVYFTGTLSMAYRAVVFSRLASRIILILHESPVHNAEDLYEAASTVDWTAQMRHEQTFSIHAAGSTEQLNHTRFIAQKVKDAIVDQFRASGQPRPDVARTEADLLMHAVIKKGQLSLGIDLTRESLHRRDYRTEQGAAPLKETLAAALLIRAGWPQLAKQKDAVLYDPLCGAGTLLIEGTLMALDIAPGLLRRDSLSGWQHHDSALMNAALEEARARKQDAVWPGKALGSDSDLAMLGIARRNAERAGVYDYIDFESAPLQTAVPARKPDLIICNPPYAERLGDEPETMALYTDLGAMLRTHGKGARAAVFTARPEWGRLLGIHSYRQYSLFNGSLPAKLLLFDINEDSIYKKQAAASVWPKQEQQVKPAAEPLSLEPLDAGARMLANRLRKNLKSLGRWARQQGHECYRLYDADMPEYAFAIDIYGERVHMQEYKAPGSVNEEDAALRRRQAIQAVSTVLQVPAKHIALKMRERQRGTEQYRPAQKEGEDFIVTEGPARLQVNLQRYLDTGLFLDHRPVRTFIREHARDKTFLNLFCYTGTATVQAALGGARRSISVDLSKTYLNWAAENLQINGFSTTQHELVQMDCLQFLQQCHQHFDMIFLDPPTFSNSKRTDNVLDIQRDHQQLIDLCMQTLAPDGLLIFSTNHRRFRLAEELLTKYQVKDYSRASIDRDFARNPRIHRVWLISHS